MFLAIKKISGKGKSNIKDIERGVTVKISIREIQDEVFSIFKLFDAYCRANDLRYYLIGGSMLGAVRHGGFIPWDDDMDVGMPRSDYKKFALGMQSFLDEQKVNALVQCSDIDKDFPFDFIKIMKKVIISGKEIEIFLDVFPLDGCPYSDQKRIKRYFQKFDILRFMKDSHYMTLQNKNILKKTIVLLLRLCPLSVYKKVMDNYLEKHDFDDSVSAGNFHGRYREKEIVEKAFFGTPKLIKFEDGMYYGVEHADAYLTAIYGNYMVPTPVDERETHFDI